MLLHRAPPNSIHRGWACPRVSFSLPRRASYRRLPSPFFLLGLLSFRAILFLFSEVSRANNRAYDRSKCGHRSRSVNNSVGAERIVIVYDSSASLPTSIDPTRCRCRLYRRIQSDSFRASSCERPPYYTIVFAASCCRCVASSASSMMETTSVRASS